MEDISRSLNEINDASARENMNGTTKSLENSKNEDIKHEIRFMMLNSFAGGLIGKGGERIKSINEKHQVHISIPMNQAKVRIAIVSGKKAALISALNEIIPYLKQAPIHVYNNREFEVNLLVSDALAPVIIGTRGARIQTLRKDTGASIKVYDENIPYSDERLVVIAGEVSKIIAAITVILTHAENVKIPRRIIHADMNRVSIDDIEEYCDNRRQSRDRPVPREYPRDGRSSFVDPYMPPYRPPPPMPSHMPIRTIQVSVPNKQIGLIAGRRSSNIQRIESMTGCKIYIERESQDCPFRVISLTGNEKQINDAEYYLQETIRESEREGPRRR